MNSYAIRVKFKILIYAFDTENPYYIPMDLISNIVSTRSLQGNSITITIMGTDLSKRVDEYFPDHAILQLMVSINGGDFIQENIGMIVGVDSSYTPKGKVQTTIQVMGFENKLTKQEIFLDLQEDDAVESLDKVTKAKTTFEGAYSQYSKVLRQTTTLFSLMRSIYEHLIRDLSNTSKTKSGGFFKFGGKDLMASVNELIIEEKSFIYPRITHESYTGNILMAFNFMGQFGIGKTVNFWQLLYAMVTEPLYELYFDNLETTIIGGKKSLVWTSKDNDYDEELKAGKSFLVFRKTPFDRLFDENNGYWNVNKSEAVSIPNDMIKSISFKSDSSRIVTGVHVGLTILEQAGNTMAFKPKWDDSLRSRYGYRLLQVKLEGVSVKDLNKGQIFGTWQDKMKAIRDRVFYIFCNPTEMKHAEINIGTAYNYFRIGLPYYIDHENDRFGKWGYLESISTTFTPTGRADSTLNFKWVTIQDKPNDKIISYG